MTEAAVHVGVDVGGTWLRAVAALADGSRGAIERQRVPLGYDELVVEIARLVEATAGSRPASVVCGLPGTSSGGRPRFVPALPFLEGRPLATELSRRVGTPVRLGFDGHLTLLAEACEGAAMDAGSAVLVAVGTGVGGAIMVDRRIWQGHHGSAGAFGWLPAAGAGVDAAHGGFEQEASGAALDRLAGSGGFGSGVDVVAAARRGDHRALEAARQYARRLGVGLAAIASVLDPEVVLLGGGMSGAADVLLPLVRATLGHHASPDGRTVPVVPAALGADAGVLGALLAAGRQEWLQC